MPTPFDPRNLTPDQLARIKANLVLTVVYQAWCDADFRVDALNAEIAALDVLRAELREKIAATDTGADA